MAHQPDLEDEIEPNAVTRPVDEAYHAAVAIEEQKGTKGVSNHAIKKVFNTPTWLRGTFRRRKEQTDTPQLAGARADEGTSPENHSVKKYKFFKAPWLQIISRCNKEQPDASTLPIQKDKPATCEKFTYGPLRRFGGPVPVEDVFQPFDSQNIIILRLFFSALLFSIMGEALSVIPGPLVFAWVIVALLRLIGKLSSDVHLVRFGFKLPQWLWVCRAFCYSMHCLYCKSYYLYH
jgi:hypothetical protein